MWAATRVLWPSMSEFCRLELPKQLVYPLHNFRRQLWHHVDRGKVLFDLFNPAGTGDHGRDVRVLGAPRNGELSWGAFKICGDLEKLRDSGVRFFAGELITEPFIPGQARPRTLGNAVQVLAGQYAQ